MGDEHKNFQGDIDVPESAIQFVDEAVIAKLPPGTKDASIHAFGASFWTRTARLDTVRDGQAKPYFLKTTYGERGKTMMFGEFTSMSKIYAATPEFCPRPIAYGTYTSNPDIHFFLCDFHEMTDELPDLHLFPAKLADLHRVATSPDGRFGFSCTTFHGNTPLNHGWADTWEEYFTRTTKILFEMEQKAQGANQEILNLTVPFFAKVVPRLLRPLETGGRHIKPALVHGDLWHGNTSTDADSELPLLYDAACFYAHNEYDLGVWRANWNKLGKTYVNRYFKNTPISEPFEDVDDRNFLYATRVNVLDSILYKGYTGYRERLIRDMKTLVDKFPGGYESWDAAQRQRLASTDLSRTEQDLSGLSLATVNIDRDPNVAATETASAAVVTNATTAAETPATQDSTLPTGESAAAQIGQTVSQYSATFSSSTIESSPASETEHHVAQGLR